VADQVQASENTDAEAGGEIDWEVVERSGEYRRLRSMQRGFIVPATVGYLVVYFGFLLLAGLAPDLMGRRVFGGITLAFVLLIALFGVVWALVYVYVKVATERWDPQADRVIAEAESARRTGVQR